jgi:hypothetical protein
MLTTTTKKRLCPFLLEPFDNCYCVKMDSQDIERAVNLCSNNFNICDIYRKKNGNGSGKYKGNGKHIILDIPVTE